MLHHLTKCRFSFDWFGVQFSTNASRCIHVSCRRFSAYQWKKIVLNFSLYIYFYITCMLITYFGKMTLILRPPQSTAIIILGRAFIFTYFFLRKIFIFGFVRQMWVNWKIDVSYITVYLAFTRLSLHFTWVTTSRKCTTLKSWHFVGSLTGGLTAVSTPQKLKILLIFQP